MLILDMKSQKSLSFELPLHRHVSEQREPPHYFACPVGSALGILLEGAAVPSVKNKAANFRVIFCRREVTFPAVVSCLLCLRSFFSLLILHGAPKAALLSRVSITHLLLQGTAIMGVLFKRERCRTC